MNENEDKSREDDDDDFEVEVVDDTPEEDRGRQRRPAKEEDRDEADDDRGGDDDPEGDDHSGDDEDDEREQYSARVQKRIKKLKYDFHEERRQREQAAREREEALKYAQALKAKYDVLNQRYSDGEGLLYQQAEGRIDAMIKAAQRDLKDAYDSAESDKIVEAQTQLANLVSEKQRIAGYRPRRSSPEQTQAPQQQPQQQPQQPQQQTREPSDRAKRWAAKNEWFNNDKKMTALAYAIHEDLITNRGVQPDTQEYYGLIDKEMRKTFPSYFKKEEDEPADVVAAPSRTAGKKPRNVRLTKSQVRIANQLGVPLKEYARQLMLDKGGKND